MSVMIKPTAEQARVLMSQGFILLRMDNQYFYHENDNVFCYIYPEITHGWLHIEWPIFNGQNEFTIPNITLTPDKTVFFPCGIPLLVNEYERKGSFRERIIYAIFCEKVKYRYIDGFGVYWNYAKLPEPETEPEQQKVIEFDMHIPQWDDRDIITELRSLISVVRNNTFTIEKIVDHINKE